MHLSYIFAEMDYKTQCWREDNDCSVKAIAIALGISYAKAWHACRKHGRRYREGYPMKNILITIRTTLNKDVVPLNYRGSGLNFVRRHPTGAFILECPSHIFAYKDGVVHDATENWQGNILQIYHILEPMNSKQFEMSNE